MVETLTSQKKKTRNLFPTSYFVNILATFVMVKITLHKSDHLNDHKAHGSVA